MNLGGLGARAALLKSQKPTKQCERCGLHYVVEGNDTCPHCGSLSDRELQVLLEHKEREQAGNRSLGLLFVVVAIGLAAVLITVSLK